METVTDQRTGPSIAEIWHLTYALPLHVRSRARWRITHADWQFIRRLHVAPVPAAMEDVSDGTWTLFGLPIEIVPTEPGRPPELVLTSERREALPQ